MRSFVPDYHLVAPARLPETLSLLGEFQPFAGGTDLMVLFEAGKLARRKFAGIWQHEELRGNSESPEHLTLGALTTYTEIQLHPLLCKEFPLLVQAARETGGIATQNRGTLGGNIANASPAGDSPPALLVYESELELLSAHGARWLPYASFHTGYKQTIMRADELISRIRLPRSSAPRRHYFRKVGTRQAQAISKVCFAGVAELNRVRIALGSVGPVVLRCLATEAAVANGASSAEAREVLAREIAPIDDIRSTSRYRLRVAQNLLEEFLHATAE